MITTINRSLTSLLARTITTFAVLGAAVLAAKTEVGRGLLLFAFLCFSGASLAKHVLIRKWPPRRRIIKSVVRSARRLRKTFAPSWEVEFLHSIVLLLGFLLLAFSLSQPQSMRTLAPAFFGLVCVFALTGSIDAVRIAIAISKFAWARWTGKAFYAGVAAFSVWAGDVTAQKLVAQATGLDPERFLATERLIHWVATPLIGLGLIVGILSLLSMVTYVIIGVGSMLKQVFRTVYSAVPRLTPPSEKASIAYRLTHGKNRMKGSRSGVFQCADTLIMMRPLAVSLSGFAILWCLAKLGELPMKNVGPAIRAVVVYVDFNPGQKCGSKIITEPMAHMEKGKMAVAIKVKDDWDLQPDVCEVEKRQPQ